MEFKLKSPFQPTGDQPKAIEQLVAGLGKGFTDQTLLGVTGSGKTFTMAKVVEQIQKPTLVIVHNKTLAAQLAAEFRDFFPDNAVHYFVSYYDYYQPEAYIPQTDTYIAKDAAINEEIDKLRQAATQALLTRKDVLIVASVSCIYGVGSPADYVAQTINLQLGKTYDRNQLFKDFVNIQYQRNDQNFTRGTFRVRGEIVEIYPSYADTAFRLDWFGNTLEKIREIDYLTGEVLAEPKEIEIFPAKHYVVPQDRIAKIIPVVERELEQQVKTLKTNGKNLEAERLLQRTNYDMEMLREVGYISGIENYSRYLEGRTPGEPPSTLIDYFPKDFLLFVDESHMTIPQIGGMSEGDRSRKEMLIEHGFRLPSASDNRPLRFDEFLKKVNQAVYVSATPGKWELERSEQVVEQLIRPTGLIDPSVEVRPTEHQIDDLINEIQATVAKGQRVLVTTLTKRMAEDLSEYLSDIDIKVTYLHSDIDTMERIDILRNLRLGKVDVLIGINLLREGLDLPEVSLVVILDADKEGFLRSATSLIQTCGRAARHLDGRVIMYADKMTGAMETAISETNRRRATQLAYNEANHITPQSIIKAIRNLETNTQVEAERKEKLDKKRLKAFSASAKESEVKALIRELENEMQLAAENLEFEKAAELRDEIEYLQGKK